MRTATSVPDLDRDSLSDHDGRMHPDDPDRAEYLLELQDRLDVLEAPRHGWVAAVLCITAGCLVVVVLAVGGAPIGIVAQIALVTLVPAAYLRKEVTARNVERRRIEERIRWLRRTPCPRVRDRGA